MVNISIFQKDKRTQNYYFHHAYNCNSSHKMKTKKQEILIQRFLEYFSFSISSCPSSDFKFILLSVFGSRGTLTSTLSLRSTLVQNSSSTQFKVHYQELARRKYLATTSDSSSSQIAAFFTFTSSPMMMMILISIMISISMMIFILNII